MAARPRRGARRRRRADHDRRRPRARAARRPRPGARRQGAADRRDDSGSCAPRTSARSTGRSPPTRPRARRRRSSASRTSSGSGRRSRTPSGSTRPIPSRRGGSTPTRLRARCAQLDARAFDAIHFSGPGTDLTVGLLPGARWIGRRHRDDAAASRTSPNLPTEEVFACPDWRRTEGTVRSTRPLQLGGTIVRDLEMRFEGGEAVEVRASTGADAVRGQMAIDEFGKRLGEVALVDGESRVGQTGITFFDTLFDENATCHIAYGAGGHLRDRRARGPRRPTSCASAASTSPAIHTDFMIGGPEVAVDGITKDGDGRADPAGGRMAAERRRRGSSATPSSRSASARTSRRARPSSSRASIEHAPLARALDARRVRGRRALRRRRATRDQHVRRAMIELGPDEALDAHARLAEDALHGDRRRTR